MDDNSKLILYWKLIEQPKRRMRGWIEKLLGHDDNAYRIQKKANEHRHELVLDPPFGVVWLLGWTDQYNDDYYWVIYSKERGVELHSCVGGFIRLNKKLDGFDYYHMKHVWGLNMPAKEQMLEEAQKEGIILK